MSQNAGFTVSGDYNKLAVDWASSDLARSIENDRVSSYYSGFVKRFGYMPNYDELSAFAKWQMRLDREKYLFGRTLDEIIANPAAFLRDAQVAAQQVHDEEEMERERQRIHEAELYRSEARERQRLQWEQARTREEAPHHTPPAIETPPSPAITYPPLPSEPDPYHADEELELERTRRILQEEEERHEATRRDQIRRREEDFFRAPPPAPVAAAPTITYPELPTEAEAILGEEAENACILCWERAIATVFVTCGHSYACIACIVGHKPTRCAICSQVPSCVIRLFPQK